MVEEEVLCKNIPISNWAVRTCGKDLINDVESRLY